MHPITTEIYVRLLNEGVETARTAPAMHVQDNIYILISTEDYDPEDEEWQFLPGTKVVCEHVDWGNNKTIFLAVREAV